MLISIHSIVLASMFVMMCGIISHLLIAFNGFLSIYLMSVSELILNKTVFFIPGLVSHLQGISMYFTMAFALMVVLGSLWINLKHYQLSKFITGPFGWVWYGLCTYYGMIGWSFSLTKTIIGKILWRSKPVGTIKN
jgi:hypothetical protein